VTIVVVVTVSGSVTVMASQWYLTPLLAADEFVRTPFVDSLPRTVNIYFCVRKVLCRLILTQVVLSVVPFVGNNLHLRKRIVTSSSPKN
jgi:hypothetical protein